MTASTSVAELTEPTQVTDGVLVIAPKLDAAATRTSPVATSDLRSADGRVTVIFLPKASDRPLIIRQTRLVDALADGSLREQAPPPGGPFGHPDLGVFLLTATDDGGQDVHRHFACALIAIRSAGFFG